MSAALSTPDSAPRRPAAGPFAGRTARLLAWCGIGWLLFVWIALDVLGDRIWWTIPILYGPRWVLAAPLVLVVPWLLTEFRRAALFSAAAAMIALFPILGTRLGVERATSAGAPLRVLELNADGAAVQRQPGRLQELVRALNPDLVIIAECATGLPDSLRQFGYHVKSVFDLCILARGEITAWSRRDPGDFWKVYGAAEIVRAEVTTPAGPLRVGLVHLATPRSALQMYFDLSEIPKQGPLSRESIAERDAESRAARAWIFTGDSLPTIVVGDFNLPVESAIYRRHWGDLRNAFSRAGWGTGHTKETRFWGVRIDHVLTTADIGTARAFVGPDVGSDHLPMIADLVLPTIQRPSTAR